MNQEIQVLVMKGYSGAEIARETGLKLRNVKAHLKRIYHHAGIQPLSYVRGHQEYVKHVRLIALHANEIEKAPISAQPGLTEREWQVTRLVVEGFTNAVVGYKLKITEGVIKNYMRSILDKTGMGSRSELALWYYAHRRSV